MGTEVVVVTTGKWGTWEELLLGGAVLRHGTRDWDVVAAELRARTFCPVTFTPEVCKAKYEDLQRRYSGCTALFEELRKQRMAELRRALELSEDSIGSLESKLEVLKAERIEDCHISYDLSQTESLVPLQISDGVESSSKGMSKDGLSAGSFTWTNWSPKCQIPASLQAEEIESKPEVSMSAEQKKFSSVWKLTETIGIGHGGNLKRRRSKRKRKDCSKDLKEASAGESEFLGSLDVLSATRSKQTSASTSGQTTRSFGLDDQCRGPSKDGPTDLMAIFDSIAENKCATVFQQRLDSQKRGRYKKMILRHMDFNTIRSRITNRTITSNKEVYRDLLLLANNALVFYSKTTREYKSALLLRDTVTKSLKHHLKDYISRSAITLLSTALPMLNPPVKPRSARRGNCKSKGKVAKAGDIDARTSNAGKRTTNVRSPRSAESLAAAKNGSAEFLAVTKKGSGQPRKSGRGSAAKLTDDLKILQKEEQELGPSDQVYCSRSSEKQKIKKKVLKGLGS